MRLLLSSDRLGVAAQQSVCRATVVCTSASVSQSDQSDCMVLLALECA